jgi:hypothetical protein
VGSCPEREVAAAAGPRYQRRPRGWGFLETRPWKPLPGATERIIVIIACVCRGREGRLCDRRAPWPWERRGYFPEESCTGPVVSSSADECPLPGKPRGLELVQRAGERDRDCWTSRRGRLALIETERSTARLRAVGWSTLLPLQHARRTTWLDLVCSGSLTHCASPGCAGLPSAEPERCFPSMEVVGVGAAARTEEDDHVCRVCHV